MKILLVEDHKSTRDEMRAMIEREPDLTVIAEVETGEEAVVRTRAERPDLVVMDILLPGINGIQAAQEILAEMLQVKILALSNHYGASLVEAVRRAGGLGYVRKNRAVEDLIPAIRSVAVGKPYLRHGNGDSHGSGSQ